MEGGSPRDGWHDSEKVYLLAEIIKTSNVRPEILLRFLLENQIEPDWYRTALPRDRHLLSCQDAYRELLTRLGIGQHHPPPGPSSPYPQGPQGPTTLQRSRAPDFAQGPGRPLQPKSTSLSYAAHPSPTSPYPASQLAPPEMTKRKRGRPTKATQQARSEAAARAHREGEYSSMPGPTAGPAGAPHPGTMQLPLPRAEPGPSYPPMPMGTPPIAPTGTDAASEGSSGGKRKRGRPSRVDTGGRVEQGPQELERSHGGPTSGGPSSGGPSSGGPSSGELSQRGSTQGGPVGPSQLPPTSGPPAYPPPPERSDRDTELQGSEDPHRQSARSHKSIIGMQ
ncbi:hypothetical protein K402DRAFT_199635 [Aulographum hederae CBS 113979]|uniref:Uncharacterized protein n=1 Tax=Aulographum hederae CBS 113979 TaxID=1176131 RepID=A0A6G1HC20_9PEZI|nr:hypothetical protein K402DRAFT_199635 [Aulographum hederae CBS 113979]